ncbi:MULTISPECIES: hypothetical protein [Microbacterium]|uniref:hypothetical protein n=1 Tax=Microbacterium TaxID=33882 RepID=UPI002788F1F5|nr:MULTISPECIES: hypothetical protein [Microbacterium]MDQ1083102.1 cytochrome bd-type quinol oxidase subunit 2 [Microbacterium sp. SORGH_AS_0344]MDQ1171626.1 cytochrome bd-type quinol oxidase subunit 2 [Microbacterium proteolyticum]
MGAFGWIEVVFWAAIAVGMVVRLTVALRRRRTERGRQAMRSAFAPVVDAAAVQSSIYGWMPTSSLEVPAAWSSTQTGEDADRRPRDLPDDVRRPAD